MTSRFALRNTICAAVLALSGLVVESRSAQAWYCEAWSNQKVGWAKGWGRSPKLDRAKRLALGNCFARSKGRKVRCSITSCKP
mgnify:CR=1 FL=1